jgi:hypothetical protein
MRNDITIDIEGIRKMPDGSVRDAETIRQIALYCIKNPNDKEISHKIYEPLSFVGLYPHIMTAYDIKPENAKVDHFDKIEKILNFSDEDKFYFLQIIKRRKDNPGMKKDLRLIDSFFIYTHSEFISYKERIKEICNQNNARAYIRLNRRSSKAVALCTVSRIIENVSAGQYKNAKNAYQSCCGSTMKETDKTWICDFDYKDFPDDFVFTDMVKTIKDLQFETGKEPLMLHLTTVNGFHLITRPFNTKKFKDAYPNLKNFDIHKDSPTLLYKL